MTACVHCSEPIESGAVVEYLNGAAHPNCTLRAVIGSVAHLEGRCSCHVPGADELDPPGMTKRQAADAAAELWRQKRGNRAP